MKPQSHPKQAKFNHLVHQVNIRPIILTQILWFNFLPRILKSKSKQKTLNTALLLTAVHSVQTITIDPV